MSCARNFLILPLLFLLLTTPGCGDPIKFAQPLVADLTADKCPPPAASSRAEARRTTPRPEPDTKLPDGAPAVSKGATAAWIDKLELSEIRKNRALARSNTELDKCRGGDAGAAKTS